MKRTKVEERKKMQKEKGRKEMQMERRDDGREGRESG